MGVNESINDFGVVVIYFGCYFEGWVFRERNFCGVLR